jgi:hypothetical protein
VYISYTAVGSDAEQRNYLLVYVSEEEGGREFTLALAIANTGIKSFDRIPTYRSWYDVKAAIND